MNTPTMSSLGDDTCDPSPTARTFLDLFNRTAIMEPSRTGGGDHSLAATRAGKSPMIFGGPRLQRDALCDPRRSMITRRIVVAAGWILARDWAYSSKVIDTNGCEMCMDMVTA